MSLVSMIFFLSCTVIGHSIRLFQKQKKNVCLKKLQKLDALVKPYS